MAAIHSEKNDPAPIAAGSHKRPENVPRAARTIDRANVPAEKPAARVLQRQIRVPFLLQNKVLVRPKSWNAGSRREPIDGAERPVAPAVRKVRAREVLPKPRMCARPSAREFRSFRRAAKRPEPEARQDARIPHPAGSPLCLETRVPRAALLPD